MKITRKQKTELTGRSSSVINSWCAGRVKIPAEIEGLFKTVEQVLEHYKKSRVKLTVSYIATDVYAHDKFHEVFMIRSGYALDTFYACEYAYKSIIRLHKDKRGKIMLAEVVESSDEK